MNVASAASHDNSNECTIIVFRIFLNKWKNCCFFYFILLFNAKQQDKEYWWIRIFFRIFCEKSRNNKLMTNSAILLTESAKTQNLIFHFWVETRKKVSSQKWKIKVLRRTFPGSDVHFSFFTFGFCRTPGFDTSFYTCTGK